MIHQHLSSSPTPLASQEVELRDFLFTVWIQGAGSTEEEAWEEANEAFFLEPGEPAISQVLDRCAVNPTFPRRSGPRLAREDLCCSPVIGGRKFVYQFKVHLYGPGPTEHEAWAKVKDDLLSSECGSELVGFEEVMLLCEAPTTDLQLDLFNLNDPKVPLSLNTRANHSS